MKKKLSLYMETTNKKPEETAADIQKLLVGYNLERFMFTYNSGNISGVNFSIKINDIELPFKLPINHIPLWIAAQNKRTKYIRNEDQARCVAWRQVFKWIQAQLALVDIGMKNIAEIFFSDLIIENGKTAFELYVEKTPALEAGKK